MAQKQQTSVQIKPINIQRICISIEGTAPYVQARFSAKSMQAMMAKHEAGAQANKRKAKEARNFDEDMKGAMHVSEDGWVGIPAAAFRNAAIDVCRMVGFKMTHARMSVFVEADGNDAVDGAPLVKLIADPPERLDMHTRNSTGVADIRVRPMWRKWKADVIFRYDADQFSADDVVNLIARAGEQVGIGEGRPFSKQSNGLGYGTFRICHSK